MRRHEWFELHDQRWFPASLRDLFTDALEAIWTYTNSYRVIVPLLRTAMEKTGDRVIIDLCSGGGGPWTRLQQEFAQAQRFPVQATLTDKYPNAEALQRANRSTGMEFLKEPIDATQLPADLQGFRTIFSTFHHFNPTTARAILADAVAHRSGIAVFEAAKPSKRRMLATALVPLVYLRVMPRIRPFCWSRIFWTYILPVVPLVLMIDGTLSCLRAYALNDLRELTADLGDGDYRWEIGEQNGGLIGITYLIGWPTSIAGHGTTKTLAEEQRVITTV